MVMKPGPLVAAARDLQKRLGGKPAPLYALTPAGEKFTDDVARRLSKLPALILLCGRYEGFDQRVIDHYCAGEISVGEFVISGGEAAALCVVDAVARHVPGVVGKEENVLTDSGQGALKYPAYTRPEVFEDHAVPKVLLSGDQSAVDAWRARAAVERTDAGRPGALLAAAPSRIVLEMRGIGFEQASALAGAFLGGPVANALLISSDTSARALFRDIAPDQTHSARARPEADRKIEKLAGPFAWIAVPRDVRDAGAARAAAAKALREGKAVVFHVDAERADDPWRAVVSFARVLQAVFQPLPAV
ncbi:MAG: hypothetical protein M5R36_17905 [Deltaproteobacteria bacterium]|nr:hypothetical protein [Deltaproteobacteria bacterium]